MFHYLSFLSMCIYIFGNLSKMILPLSFCIALWDIYYVHLFFQDIKDDVNRIVDFMEHDFNRIVDFLINIWVSFQISFLNFINILHLFFGQFEMEAIKLIKWIHNLELNCRYIYII